MKNTRKVDLLFGILIVLMLVSLPFAVPSAAILEEADQRYVDSTPMGFYGGYNDDYEEYEDYQEDEIEGSGGSMAPEDWVPPEVAFSLPFDLTPGQIPNPALFTETTYVDASISVIMEDHRAYDADFHVARVKIAHPSQLRTALAGRPSAGRTAKPSLMAENNNAVVAMNGDYYGNRKSGYIIRQGTVIRKNLPPNLHTLFIDENGDFHIVKGGDQDSLAALLDTGLELVNAFSFGPALVIDGELMDMPDSYSFNIRGEEPRSAIGQIGPLEYLLVVVDGRRTNSDGVTVENLGQFMYDMGCLQAFNLDGGGTAVMLFNNGYFSNKTENGERSISDIIYFATTVE